MTGTLNRDQLPHISNNQNISLTQYIAKFAFEDASYVATDELIKENMAAAVAIVLVENIVILSSELSNLKRS